VPSIKIEPIPLREVNRHFYYAEKVRDELARLGFSEIFTSSFRDKDEVKLKNALASDKGYLRSAQGIVENMKEALSKNAPNADLFGVDQIRLFEFGKVFEGGGEYEVLVLGVRSKQGYTKKDLVTMNDASETLKKMIEIVPISSLRDAQTPIYWNDCMTYLIDFRVAVQALPLPTTYAVYSISDITYKPFSLFPYLTRDIAFWCDASTSEEEARGTILGSVGSLVQRVDMFDRFEKGGRVSYGFRIVFQSYEKTLDSAEADAFMQSVYDAVRAKGFEVR
jgi:phenylalanyl-tRNA synthetase beta subunit